MRLCRHAFSLRSVCLVLLVARVTNAQTINEFTIPTADSNPYGITLGPDGAMWFAENGAGKIGRIDQSGSITEFPLPSIMRADRHYAGAGRQPLVYDE